MPAEYSEKEDLIIIPKAPDQCVSDELIERLVQMSKINGKFSISSSAYRCYEKWAIAHEKEMSLMPDERGITGFYSRLAIYVLKLAMIFEVSLNCNINLSISELSMNRAINYIGDRKKDIKSILNDNISFSSEEKLKKKIIKIISERGKASKSEILRAGYIKKTLNPILETLVEEGTVNLLETGDRKKKAIYSIVDN